MTEVWKDIPGYPGYQASNKGRIRTHGKVSSNKLYARRQWKDRVLREKVDKQNSHRVSLWNDEGQHDWLVARIIALTFLGAPESKKMTVNHKDGNRNNNNVSNLEWLSLADNIKHAFRTGLMASVQKPCILVDYDGWHYEFPSRAEASRWLGRKSGYIANAIKKGFRITDFGGAEFDVILPEGNTKL